MLFYLALVIVKTVDLVLRLLLLRLQSKNLFSRLCQQCSLRFEESLESVRVHVTPNQTS
jgi:hypothetical protein